VTVTTKEIDLNQMLAEAVEDMLEVLQEIAETDNAEDWGITKDSGITKLAEALCPPHFYPGEHSDILCRLYRWAIAEHQAAIRLGIPLPFAYRYRCPGVRLVHLPVPSYWEDSNAYRLATLTGDPITTPEIALEVSDEVCWLDGIWEKGRQPSSMKYIVMSL